MEANFCFNLIHQTPHNTKITRFDRSPLTNKTERDVEGGRAGDGRSVLRRTESLPSRRDPPNAVYGDPKGIPIHQTIYRDTPAPFNCVYCGNSGLTHVRLVILRSQILVLLRILHTGQNTALHCLHDLHFVYAASSLRLSLNPIFTYFAIHLGNPFPVWCFFTAKPGLWGLVHSRVMWLLFNRDAAHVLNSIQTCLNRVSRLVVV
ncbi:hypothetical protein Prudu_567S000300 [Prunus dulcis]|uniref:Uncharacterized protein n=1 Tax=Prunus dulcis TaxID=3755 RepID=A0A4Y1QPR2_PRUDU|nr:hypothetical protein Prudu_001988 [Prunus dulcis]BBN68768.1 hypothetical protein Prudu_567S000300 [Prunus dulcis]